MTNWIVEQSLLFSLTVLLLIVCRNSLSRALGISGLYWLWALVPVQLGLASYFNYASWTLPSDISYYVVSAKSYLMPTAAVAEASNTLGMIWLSGCIACALVFAIQHLRFQISLQQATRRDDRFANHIQLPKSVNIAFSHAVHSPLLTGLLRPTIVLPEHFASLHPSTQTLMLEHELVHVKRHDLTWNLIGLAVVCLFWFNPLAWMGYRHFRQTQEMACDEQVLRHQPKATRVHYASTLLEQIIAVPNHSFTTLYYGGKQNMQERLNNIKQGFAPNWRVLPVAALLVACSLGVQAVSTHDKAAIASEQVVPVMRIEPVYPADAAKQGLEGTVVLSYTVNTDGSVSDVKVIESDHNGIFDNSALTALKQWTYSKPKHAQKDNLVALEFLLSEEPSGQASEMERIHVKKHN